MSTIERRAFEVRASKGSNGHMLSGLAIRYGATTIINGPKGGFVERIAPGAAHGVLTSPKCDVRFLWNHNSDAVLGRTKSGTLRLTETRQGVAYECDLPDTQVANDLYTSVLRGDVTGCSFGFLCGAGDDEWGTTEVEGRSMALRTINNFSHLQDISPVAYPAYEGTSIEARHARGKKMPAELRQLFQSICNRSVGRGVLWQHPRVQAGCPAGHTVMFLPHRLALRHRSAPADYGVSIRRRKSLLGEMIQ